MSAPDVDDITIVITIPEYDPASTEEDPNEIDDVHLERAYVDASRWLERHAPTCPNKEDLVQDTILSVWQAFGRFIGNQKDFDKWVRTIVRNKFIDDWRKEHIRKLKTVPFEELEFDKTVFSDEDSVEFHRTHRGRPPYSLDKTTSHVEESVAIRVAITKALKSIATYWPTGQESIQLLVKYHLLGMSHEEIANELGISVVASKSRLFKLRECLARTALRNSIE